ncbi:MAG: nicotinate (nicotinamide) nucleotide adenylyltransferase [Candidatus Wallbacteria bacterium HGW-Wallbacteria-1]|jgi:nicotinate-nucleotide adenylyltransferase|uniref:Probable nicotinate-nucleotide adenylyltransferase n=1 Tax=Candidatus Wallbacteria bacterium HGW-Wallbacteria-1 TaxID=2013854 RepID=A0A2N1PTU7_9BACT|nr:MAG: nicotinate (nicotinamide) nucleotide adenylyltransferase [Candidatus Wallbacteria bacterium HGW-Wallbacteria-1]
MGRVAIYGGTFDPPHRGHVAVVRELSSRDDIDKILVLPTWKSPLKEMPQANIHHRLVMAGLALDGIPGVEVNDHEAYPCLDTANFSVYTADTLKHLSMIYRNLVLVLGSDIQKSFLNWKNVEQILKLADIMIIRRPGEKTCSLAFDFESMEIEGVQISSGEIRGNLISSAEMKSVVPPNVLEYIKVNGLYFSMNDNAAAQLEKSLEFVRNRLKGHRLNHSLAVAVEAERIAIVYGLNPFQARLGGLLHDSARDMESIELDAILREPHGQIASASFSGEVRAVLHGPCAAVLVRRELEIEDSQILEAITYHATGCPGMSPVAAAVYLADFAEPSRKFPQARQILEELRSGSQSLGALLLKTARFKAAFLARSSESSEQLGAAFLDHLEMGGWREYDMMPSCLWRKQ